MASLRIPAWLQEWAGFAIPVAQALAILMAAWLLLRVLRIVVRRICDHYHLPAQVAVSARRLLGVLVYVSAFMVALGRLGVSGSVLWTALTGFTAVAAVAFFAAWSVLSNIFCTLLIITTRPFRLDDRIEVLEAGDKPGFGGRVIDINLIYTTLQEVNEQQSDTRLQIPNSLFFQRTLRRWHGEAAEATEEADGG